MRTILIICTRRIGDVLLATPIARSLKTHWPNAQIDMLVFQGTEGVLAGNPDIRDVIVVARRAPLRERIRDALSLWRRYDLACAATTSDRAHGYAWLAGRWRVGLVEPEPRKKHGFKRWKQWKQWILNAHAVADKHAHTVTNGLSIIRALKEATFYKGLGLDLSNLIPVYEVVPPTVDASGAAYVSTWLSKSDIAHRPNVVLHFYPMFRYKQWHEEGWLTLIHWLRNQGYAIILTGGPADSEIAYIKSIAERAAGDLLNLAGQLSLAETAEVIRQAKLFIGPDTSTAHIAAATGTPTITLFGPSDPIQWGPWPKGCTQVKSPWKMYGSQRHHNVYLVQGPGHCVPCLQEGCDRHINSRSDCLLTLDAHTVIQAATVMLG